MENLSCCTSGGSITSAHKEVEGGGRRWARGYTSKWEVESRDEIIGLYWLFSGWYTEKNKIENIFPTL